MPIPINLPSTLLELIPKKYFNLNYLGVQSIIEKIATANAERIEKALDHSKKVQDGTNTLIDFLSSFDILPYDRNTKKFFAKNFLISKMKQKAAEQADLNLDENATSSERAFYVLGKLLELDKSTKNNILLKVLDSAYAKTVFESNYVEISTSPDDLEEGEIPTNSRLNRLVFIYLANGESDLRRYLREQGYDARTITYLVQIVRNEAEKNSSHYEDYITPIKNSAKAIREAREQVKVARENLKRKVEIGRKVLNREYDRFKIIRKPTIKKIRKINKK